ncbi:MAG: translation termination factor GTPase eRF3 [Watsoniomyces obsoletus]|nr:MAG: translation termination factor GTPase eRF3 [Watsoniomyces obsoletus]
MDIAYDHIQEEVLSPDTPQGDSKKTETSLNTEFAEAYKAISSSPWGARLGALVGTVKKQSESYLNEAKQEYNAASSQASKGFSELVNRTRSLSLTKPTPKEASTKNDPTEVSEESSERTPTADTTPSHPQSEGVLSRFRSEALKRLKELEKAEDAADEALLKFGTNVRNFLREAVSIAPPSDDVDGSGQKKGTSEILYESKDQEGKRVIHTTRFDAQLHVIHTRSDSFVEDPASPEFETWKDSFNVDKETDRISVDLEKYKDLRAAMEKLVPDQVKYEDFWTRYYFLRHIIEAEEMRRRDIMKGVSTAAEEEIAWDEDSDTETTPAAGQTPETAMSNNENNETSSSPANNSSTTTLHQPVPSTTTTTATSSTENTAPTTNPSSSSSSSKPTLDPKISNTSNDEHSLAGSDASYDVVSGAPSGAPGSPTMNQDVSSMTENGMGKKSTTTTAGNGSGVSTGGVGPGKNNGTKVEESEEEEDWE